MLIFKDVFTGDEMFTDSYKYKLVDNVVYEVYGKYVSRKIGDVTLDGANPSAEEQDEGTDDATESGIDVILNQRLVEASCFGDKKQYTSYIKEYMKRVATKLEQDKPDQVEVFKSNMSTAMKGILGKFKDLQFYTGESCNIDEGMVAIVEYRDVDGEEIPIVLFFKHGLLEEKY